MACNFLANKIKRWVNRNGGKNEKEFSLRFRGKESFLYMKNIPSLIRILFLNVTSRAIKKPFIEVHLQSTYLRTILPCTVRISDFNAQDLVFRNKTAEDLFRMCCAFDSKISPNLWAVCNVSPVHAEISLKSYRFDIGCNTMEDREQKNQVIPKYSENNTPQNRLSMIFRHEYLHLIYLRLNGYDDIKHLKKTTSYITKDDADFSCEI